MEAFDEQGEALLGVRQAPPQREGWQVSLQDQIQEVGPAVTTLRADGVAYLNVKANECGHWVHPTIPRCSPDCDYGVARAEWRALADATCELSSCDGGWIDTMRGDLTEHCEGCRGTGKPIHTLSVECSHRARLMADSGTYPIAGCLDCDGSGTVSVDVVVAELVPVVDNDGKQTTADHLRSPSKTAQLVQDGAHPDRFWLLDRPLKVVGPINPLGPPLSPGDWVAVLKVVAP